MWQKYLTFATLSYSIFNTPNLAIYSAYELDFGNNKTTFRLENQS